MKYAGTESPILKMLFFFMSDHSKVFIYEYERQGPAPRAFFGQNRNYLFNFECQPSVQGLAWISPPKKLFKTQFFDPAPRSNQPQDLSISEWSLMWWQLLQALLQLPQIRKV